MEDDAKAALKDGILAEYGAMRIEIRERIAGQGRVAAGSVALIGGFIGILATVKIEGGASLIAAVLAADTGESLHVFGVLCAGFVLGMELLLSFWAYQLFLMFRICGYLKKLESQLKAQFQIPDSLLLLSWESYAASMADISVPNNQMLVRRSLQAVSYIQPLSFFALSGLGLIMLGLHKWVSGTGYTPHAGMGDSSGENPTTGEGDCGGDDSKKNK